MELSARQQVALFLALTFFFSLCCEWYIIRQVHTVHSAFNLPLILIPGAVGIFCTWFCGDDWRELGLRQPLAKYLIFAYSVPAFAALLILIFSIALGVNQFELSDGPRSAARLLVFAPTIGVVLSSLAALAEELGWRGFLQPRLRQMAAPMPWVLTGMIWAMWQWPLILWSDFSPSPLPVLSVFLFTLSLCGFSVFLGWLRERSRSLWPVVLAHGAHNCWIQSIYPGFLKTGPMDVWFGGESGFILAILYLILAIAVLRLDDESTVSA